MPKLEFEIIDNKDVKLHFGKYKDYTFKELSKFYSGMRYMRWLYRHHSRITQEVKDILREIYYKNLKYYRFPYSCPEVWAYSWAGRYPSLADDSDEAVEWEREARERGDYDDFSNDPDDCWLTGEVE